LHTYACRSDRHSIFESHKLPHNSYINGAVLGTLALQLAPLLVPQGYFNVNKGRVK